MGEKVKLSVCVVTYNHEKYIAQCLNSLVNQEVDFSFEIIVGDDASTDSTSAILRDFVSKYPEMIVPIYHQKNIGSYENTMSVFGRAKGKYIANIDGDDYALPGKLAAQVKTLEENTNCVICTHDVEFVDQQGRKIKSGFRKTKPGIKTLMDLYEHLPFFANSSKVFLNDLNEEFWRHLDSNAIDIEVHVEQAKKGDIYHIGNVLGGYRVATGISREGGRVNPKLIEACNRVYNAALKDSDVDVGFLKKCHARAMLSYAYQSAVLGDVDAVNTYIRKSWQLAKYSLVQCAFYFLAKIPRLLVFVCHLSVRFRGIK